MHFDILVLQDTKIPNTNYEQLLSNQFHAYSCHWSTYCGLVCFSPNIITPLLHTLDGHGLLVTVSDINSSFEPFYIFNIYAPAPDQLRYLFFSTLLSLLQSPSLTFLLSRCFILGDFNYSYTRSDSSYLKAPVAWLDFLSSSFFNLTSSLQLPTFKSHLGQSSIDHIFTAPEITPHCYNPDLAYLDLLWTDHAIISTSLQFTNQTGKGFWRANPALIHNSDFCDVLQATLDQIYNIQLDSSNTQLDWNQVKTRVQQVCRKFSRKKDNQRTSEI
ncbi:hypothetical protein BDC45DRAFT_452830 [Circinella umbellata]|nr:hypothetical protein BDC45DRAFT_452830 [Circinella umbellata]